MLGNEISDYKKLKAIRAKLADRYEEKVALKTLLLCGSKVLAADHPCAVALVANNKTARFYGNTSCKSPWCCPVCTARQMSKYASKISAALDALKDTHNAAMITFTIPHTRDFSCEDVTEVLYDTWKAFTVHGNKVLKANPNDIFSNFMAATESKHRVRVTEYTYGQSGWHAHLHCLFWFPKKHWNEILDWEERLEKRWLEIAKRYLTRRLLSRYPETERQTVKAKVETRMNIMFSKLDEGCHGVWISKSEGKPIIQKSSNYLCGWGGDKELTGNVQEKATAEGHYSWQEILDKAVETGDDKWWNLYFEYAKATKKARHARVNFSVHSGLCKIIAEHINTEGYKSVLKKNATDLEDKIGKWRLVCWFSATTWRGIYENRLEADILNFGLNGEITKIDCLLAQYDLPKCIPKDEAAVTLTWLEAA